MKTTATIARHKANGSAAPLKLELVISDQAVIAYLSKFDDEETESKKALEALKVGVIAIQSASPTLDTQVVQAKFSEVESRLKVQLGEFQKEVTENLCHYFEDEDGIVPRSIDGVFGDAGSLTRTFQTFFDPNEGRLRRLLQTQIGPESLFGKALNPQNKEGIIALIEARIQLLVEAKLNEVLEQFSLDEDKSAMSRLKKMLSDFFTELNSSLGIKSATALESEKGHVKGMEFEKDLYDRFAKLGAQLGDDTHFVRGTVGAQSRCKKGDYIAHLGETSGAPGLTLAVEIKDQPLKLKAAIDELQEAKANRQAAVGIFVFARGCEPPEVGDFRRIGEDFYVTVDKDDLANNKPLLFFDAAYKIARALAIAAVRKQATGEIDIAKIQNELDALAMWSDRISDMVTKARTIQNNGRLIEQCANEMKQDLEDRIAKIFKVLQYEAVPKPN